MDRKEIEALRDQVSCVVVLEQAGFARDAKESTRRALKFRRGARSSSSPTKGADGSTLSAMRKVMCSDLSNISIMSVFLKAPGRSPNSSDLR